MKIKKKENEKCPIRGGGFVPWPAYRYGLGRDKSTPVYIRGNAPKKQNIKAKIYALNDVQTHLYIRG